MEKEKKITQKEFYDALVKALKGEEQPFTTDELVEFVDGRVAQLNKKSTNRKPNKTQTENEPLKAELLALLTNEGMTVSEIMAKSETFSGKSNQKVSALLRILKEEGKVVRDDTGKKTLYRLA